MRMTIQGTVALVAAVALMVGLLPVGYATEAATAPGGEPRVATSEADDFSTAAKKPKIKTVARFGAMFNDASARADSPGATRFIRYLNNLIKLTPKGQTIRISQYNLARKSTVNLLVKARKRGVNLQIVVNDKVLGNDVTKRTPYPRLKRLLGSNPKKKNFFVICKRGCRTGPGSALHIKFITIGKVRSQVGPIRNVVITASGNITGWAANRQYNDSLTIVNKPYWTAAFNKMFKQLARDKKVRKPFRRFQQGGITAWFFPRPGAHRASDPIWNALRRVKCKGAGKAGQNGRTVVRVKMFTWNGNRGLNLARKLYTLDRAGCKVEVILGAPGAGVVKEVRRPGPNGGIAVWDSRRDRNGNGELDLYTHMKMLSIEGRVGKKRSTRMVYTGSANWTPQAFTRGDELLVRVKHPRIAKQYRNHFEFVKKRSRRLPNTSTTVAKIKPYNLLPIAE